MSSKPQPKTTNLHLPPELRERLSQSAEKQGRTLKGHIVMILKGHVEKEFGK